MRIRVLLLLGTVIVLGCTLSWGESTSAQKLSLSEAKTEELPATISMDFKDANLKDILKIFSQQSGLNFIAGEDIAEKKVTLYLDTVLVSDALNSIIEANNLTYEQAENSHVFIVKDSGKPAIKTKTNVYYLKYAQVTAFREEKPGKGIIDVMTGLLSENGKLVADERTNSVIITDVPSQFSIIEPALAKLDIKTPQVMIEVEILDTKLSLMQDLGVKWPAIAGTLTGGSRETKFPFNTDLLHSAEITVGTLSLYRGASALAFNALISDTDTKILARPRILTLSNQTAEIKITADTAVGIQTSTTAESGDTTETAERVETGISLEVTPQVSGDGYITMFIKPKVSSAVASKDLGTTQNYFDAEERSAEAIVRVKDGETVVIGGLIKTNSTEIMKKVPLLGDIPFLGALFRNKDVDKEERELIIFITPHILREEVRLAGVSAEELWFPGEREQEPSISKEEAMEKAMEEALKEWEK